MRLRVGHQHSHIRPILVRFMHYYSAFWGPRAISTIDEPRVRLCFMDYYSPFWGPNAISIVVELQGVLTVGHPESQFGPIVARFLDYT